VELSIRVTTRPVPGFSPRVLVYVIVIVIVAVLVAWTGQELVTLLSLIAGTGLLGGRNLPVLVERGPAAELAGEPEPPSDEFS
jgi:hypothetical protein